MAAVGRCLTASTAAARRGVLLFYLTSVSPAEVCRHTLGVAWRRLQANVIAAL